MSNFGWHSGVVHAKGIQIVDSGFDTILNVDNTLKMSTAALAQNSRNIILNNTILGGIVGAVSKLNAIEQTITHSTTNMPNLRLKCADWTVVATKNVKDIYAIQLEVDVGSAAVISGQLGCLSTVVQLNSSGSHTGEIQALYASVGGTGAGTCAELTVAKIGFSNSGVHAKGIIEFGCGASANAHAALLLDGEGTAETFLTVPAAGGMVGSCASITSGSFDQTATCDAALKCSISGHTVYIPLYNAVTMS